MGQQQLLLVILGVIIVGLSIMTVIRLFEANSLETNRDAVYIDTLNIAAEAQHYFQVPRMLSGGGGSFVGFSLRAESQENENGTYIVSNVTENTVNILGVGKQQNTEGRSYHVTTVANPTSIQSTSTVLE